MTSSTAKHNSIHIDLTQTPLNEPSQQILFTDTAELYMLPFHLNSFSNCMTLEFSSKLPIQHILKLGKLPAATECLYRDQRRLIT